MATISRDSILILQQPDILGGDAARAVGNHNPVGVDDIQIRLPVKNGVGDRLRQVVAVHELPVPDQPHEIFHREGNDVICELPVSYSVATLGGVVEVPTVSGVAKMKVPAGTQTGTILRMRGKGMPALRGGVRGDMHVRIFVEVPAGLNREQQQLLEQFEASLKADKNYPLKSEFLNKAKRFMT